MVSVLLDLPDGGVNVERNVIFAVINQITNRLRIEDCYINFKGEIQRFIQVGGSLKSSPDRPLLASDKLLTIEVEEETNTDHGLTTGIGQHEYPPVFLDSNLDISLIPIYSTTNVTINFVWTTPSRVEAKQWYNQMLAKIGSMMDVHLHDLTYHYGIPEAFGKLIYEVYQRRELAEPYGDSLTEYLVNNSSPRLTVLGDANVLYPELVISETQTRVIGTFTIDPFPDKPQVSDKGGNYTVSLGYKFSYMKPIHYECHYPIVIHNNLLPVEFYDFVDLYREQHDTPSTTSGNAFSYFEIPVMVRRETEYEWTVNLPKEDLFQPKVEPKAVAPLYYALSLLESDLITFGSIFELGDYGFDPDITEFIRSEIPWLTKQYKSIFNLKVYQGYQYLDTLTVTTDGTVVSTVPVTLRSPYRLRFGLVVDLSLLDKEALWRLYKFKYNYKILSMIDVFTKSHFSYQKYRYDFSSYSWSDKVGKLWSSWVEYKNGYSSGKFDPNIKDPNYKNNKPTKKTDTEYKTYSAPKQQMAASIIVKRI